MPNARNPIACSTALFALASAALAGPQHDPWSCEGWYIEDSRYSHAPATAMTPDDIARIRRIAGTGTPDSARGVLDLYPTGPAGGPERLIGSFQPAELDGVHDIQGLAASGRIIATRASFFSDNPQQFRCVIFELRQGTLRTSTGVCPGAHSAALVA